MPVWGQLRVESKTTKHDNETWKTNLMQIPKTKHNSIVMQVHTEPELRTAFKEGPMILPIAMRIVQPRDHGC